MQTLQIENENLPLILINKERDWNDYYYYVFIILNESMSKTDIHVGFLMRTGFSTKDELLLYKCRFRLIPRAISHFRRKKKWTKTTTTNDVGFCGNRF